MRPILAKQAKQTRGLAAQATYKFQRILVAVDFSEESRNALACAAELAARCGASLVLVHVVEPHLCPVAGGVHPSATGSGDEQFAEAKLELNDLGAHVLGQCRVVETSVRGGLAFFEITEAAKVLGADLIVIGPHGVDGRDSAVLGGTAEKVMRHAPCPVLVARENRCDTRI